METLAIKVAKELKELRETKSTTRDGHHIVLSANIELPDDVEAVATHGAEGIGLYRTEFLYLNRGVASGRGGAIRNVSPGGGAGATESAHHSHVRSRRRQTRARHGRCRRRAESVSRLARDSFLSRERRHLQNAIARHSSRQRGRQREDHVPDDFGIGRAAPSALSILHECKDELRKSGIAFSDTTEVGAMIEVPSAAISADMPRARSRFLQHRHERSDSIRHRGRSRERTHRASLRADASFRLAFAQDDCRRGARERTFGSGVCG